MVEAPRGRALVADVLAVAGGGGLLASAFLHWIRRGPGSGLRGHDLVDTVVALGNTLPGLSAARLTALWYVVPALGALAWVTVGLSGAASRTTRAVAVTAAATTVLVLAAFVHLAGLSALGPGALLAAAGATALSLSAATTRP